MSGTGNKKVSAPKFNRDYFTLPHPFWMVMIPFGLWLLAMATVSPNKVPSFLGPFASLAVFMGTTYPNICLLLSVFAVLMHSLEAAFAGKLCHDRDFSAGATAKWTVSTFFFGGSSLVRLWPAKPPYKIV
ncbi:uncharacterized protein LOC101856219 isoform X1 [Aplysia californica]|uniref:Transmembrane protein 254 n=1 Tax=Aplysia californica TaxID=6500 RepID=A0ABM0K6C3_APLCA|nr:uncharacterized protein LOC101856219 isoform X1 [Aplysia californica]